MRRNLTWADGVETMAALPLLAWVMLEHPGFFQGWVTPMVLLVLAVVGAGLVIGPLHVLIHELGHALAALALTGGRVVVHVGNDENPVRFGVGRRIEVRMTPFAASGGRCEFDRGHAPRLRWIAIVVAGPLASGALAFALFQATLAVSGSPFLMLTVGNGAIHALLGFCNLIPSTHLQQYLPCGPPHALATDGLLILRELRGEQRHPLRLRDDDVEAFLATRASEPFRMVMATARQIARDLEHPEPGGMHALHALARHPETEAARRLLLRGVDPVKLDLPLPEAPGSLTAVLLGAAAVSAERIAPEHLLLHLTTDATGAAAAELDRLGVDRAALAAELTSA